MASSSSHHSDPPTSPSSKAPADSSSAIADGTATGTSGKAAALTSLDAGSVEETRQVISAMLRDIRLLDASDEDNQI